MEQMYFACKRNMNFGKPGAKYCGLNCTQNSHVEVLPPNVTIFGEMAIWM